MINTYERDARQQSTEHLTNPNWSDATKIVEGIKDESVFKDSLYKSGVNPDDPTTPEYARALADYADDYCNIYGDDLAQKTQHEIVLLAGIPNLFHVQDQISIFNQEKSRRRLDKNEWSAYNQLIRETVAYNQLLSDFIYTHPDDSTMSGLNQTLSEQAFVSFPRHAERIASKINQETRGARTEAATRHLLDIAGVPYERGTVYEDTRGGDIIIKTNNQRIKVDIKSSLDQIAKINGGYDEIQEHNKTYAISKASRDRSITDHVIAIFPGFTDHDFGDSLKLQLNSEDLQQRSQALAAQLMRAVIELNR